MPPVFICRICKRLVMMSRIDQDDLNDAAISIFEQHGCLNSVKAEFIKCLSGFVMDSDDFKLLPVKPRVRPMDDKKWARSLCFVVAYLRRYKMEKTLQAMKCECALLPKNTGFNRASDLENYFQSLKKVALMVSDLTFDERVVEFISAVEKVDGHMLPYTYKKRRRERRLREEKLQN